ncbi:6-O-methylguanine DNA methyltransferase [Aspergillus leporis]|uniref:Methylated-DNA--protein-cysteine methyltransferase n=1 Tax=Aspergillus leporis TaxID=41062 RepID=A0A5N5WFY1_9EURO|nr:6-O-methylguanine DNA methyltransferase [Aspergillus leporis]
MTHLPTIYSNYSRYPTLTALTAPKPLSPPKSITTPQKPPKQTPQPANIKKQAHRIKSHPTLTPHQRRVYLTLLTIPQGRWTTYSALAKHLHSSARAIGTAMRTNPFAPEVPCHRVLSVDGGLGGYMGAGPASGSGNLERKRRLLEGEGVGFVWVGGSGGSSKVKKGFWKARGECFVGFE